MILNYSSTTQKSPHTTNRQKINSFQIQRQCRYKNDFSINERYEKKFRDRNKYFFLWVFQFDRIAAAGCEVESELVFLLFFLFCTINPFRCQHQIIPLTKFTNPLIKMEWNVIKINYNFPNSPPNFCFCHTIQHSKWKFRHSTNNNKQ